MAQGAPPIPTPKRPLLLSTNRFAPVPLPTNGYDPSRYDPSRFEKYTPSPPQGQTLREVMGQLGDIGYSAMNLLGIQPFGPTSPAGYEIMDTAFGNEELWERERDRLAPRYRAVIPKRAEIPDLPLKGALKGGGRPLGEAANQKALDELEKRLIKDYGEEAWLSIPLTRPESVSNLEMRQMIKENVRRHPISPSDLEEYRRLIEAREAIDAAQVSRNTIEVSKKFESLIPDKGKRDALVRRITQADLPAYFRTENRDEPWRAAGDLANEITQYVSKNVTHDPIQTAFAIRAELGGTAAKPGIQLRLTKESGLGPSARTMEVAQEWLDKLMGTESPRLPKVSR